MRERRPGRGSRAPIASNQLDDVLALPDHLRDALWRVESARLEPFDAAGGLVVCGMGGSAIGGDLAAVALGNRLSRPLTTERGYELPSCMLPDRAVLCSSYSGDTEETIACYEAAEALGARRIVATTGGQLADAARRDGVPVIGLPAGPAAARRGRLHCSPSPPRWRRWSGRRRGSAPRSTARRRTCARPATGSPSCAAELAEQLEGSIPVDLRRRPDGRRSPYRWKTQINENAKLPAFARGAARGRPQRDRRLGGRATSRCA